MVTTRTGGPADATAVARLLAAADLARLAETGPPAGPAAGADDAEAERQLRRRLADPAGFLVLAEENGELLAMTLILQALAHDGAGTDPVPGLAHVSMVTVRPDRWGRGLGAVVLAAALGTARERGFTRAQLWTHETNRRAQRLYERLGWTATGRTMVSDQGEPLRQYVCELRGPASA